MAGALAEGDLPQKKTNKKKGTGALVRVSSLTRICWIEAIYLYFRIFACTAEFNFLTSRECLVTKEKSQDYISHLTNTHCVTLLLKVT